MQPFDPMESVVVREPYAPKGARTVLWGGYSRKAMSLPSKPNPNTAWNPVRLDVRAFAQAGASVTADDPMGLFERLKDELHPESGAADLPGVHWQAHGALRAASGGGEPAVWLHLRAETVAPLTCQRCLGAVEAPLQVDRWFRFVADEATAAAEDNDCEEDLLPLEPRPSLYELLEDELLMALPLVPMHDACPVPVSMQSGDVAAADGPVEEQRPHPFAALSRLKK